jgi:hypothetical protein
MPQVAASSIRSVAVTFRMSVCPPTCWLRYVCAAGGLRRRHRRVERAARRRRR